MPKVKITYKGKSRLVPDTYLKGLKGKEREKQIKSIFEGKDRPKTKAPEKRSSYARTGQEKIINKGRGAYYSSGSRPNQTPESWGLGRLASVILNGPARRIDKTIWDKYKITNKSKK